MELVQAVCSERTLPGTLLKVLRFWGTACLDQTIYSEQTTCARTAEGLISETAAALFCVSPWLYAKILPHYTLFVQI